MQGLPHELYAVWFIKFNQSDFNIALTAMDIKTASPAQGISVSIALRNLRHANIAFNCNTFKSFEIPKARKHLSLRQF